MDQQSILEKLPSEFKDFLTAEGIDFSVFSQQSKYRYIRSKPFRDVTLEKIQKEISEDAQQVDWIPEMFALPQDVKISSAQLYKDGSIYGIDLSSAAVVQALDIKDDDHQLLEVCCAPGAKLLYIADKLTQLPNPYSRKVYGIDINNNRLNVTKQMVQKYKLDHMVNLILGDGTTYKIDTEFDKILVDAECTHEGSIKHLEKYVKQQNNQEQTNLSKKEQKDLKQSQKQLKKNHTNKYISKFEKSNEWSKDDFLSRVLDPVKLKNITDLQYNLLTNSFNILKQGGYLVYSTCSFSRKQNEDIIERFLKEHPGQAEQVHPFHHLENKDKIPCKPGHIPDTVRFEPSISQSGGMFVAKLRKL